VVRIHIPNDLLSYARVGDINWTWVDAHEECKDYVDVCYNSRDGLFYALQACGDVHTIDLHGPSARVNIVYIHEGNYRTDSKYIAQAPWGDCFQIWRWDRYLEDEEVVQEEDDEDNDVDETMEEIVVETGEDGIKSEVKGHEEIEVVNEDRETKTATEEEEVKNVDVFVTEKEKGVENVDVSMEEKDRVNNLDVPMEEKEEEKEEKEKERMTSHFDVYKIDFGKQKLAKVRDLRDHTLFTGFNTSFLFSAKECSTLIPNSIYHADDLNLNTFCKRFSERRVLNDQGLRHVSIFNMEDNSFTNILPPDSSRLNCPPPVWIQPSLSRV
jgi:hypothetical protein